MADNGRAEAGKGKYQPSEFLKSVLGRPVVVKLNSGVDYRGVLACLDGYMNIAMEQTEEYVNGQLKAKYGNQTMIYSVFIRKFICRIINCVVKQKIIFCFQVIALFVEITVPKQYSFLS